MKCNQIVDNKLEQGVRVDQIEEVNKELALHIRKKDEAHDEINTRNVDN